MKVVSGGQTGVDRAALDSALAAGLPVGGFVPKGRLAEDGAVPAQYPLEECDSADYAVRTELNVRHSDATVILTRGGLSGGSLLTSAFCRKHKKPVLVLDLDAADPQAPLLRFRAFLKDERPAVLNVAGPRESRAPGIYQAARKFLEMAFRAGPAPA